jgi:hypothetical protein
LKHNKYIFDIPIPFCHDLFLSATLKQFLTEFAARYNLHGNLAFEIPPLWFYRVEWGNKS